MSASIEVLERFIVDLHETILPIVTDPPSDPAAPAPDAASLVSAFDAVVNASTLFTIAFRGPPEDPEECAPAARSLGAALTSAAVLASAACARSCAPLRARVRTAAVSTVEATAELARWLAHQRRERREVAPLLGVVWQYARSLAGLSLDNGAAASAAMTQWLPSMRDALDELNDVALLADGDGDGSDADEEGMTAEQLEVRPAVATAIKVAVMAVRKCAGVAAGVADDVEWLDGAAAGAERVAALVDETACCVYPPQDRAALAANAERLAGAVRSLVALAERRAAEQGDARTLRLLADKATEAASQLAQLAQLAQSS
eukprot:m51a1_g14625 hypothetical protein (318) ;mRNA; r:1238090-1239151